MTAKIIDISQTVETGIVVWPGDTPFSHEWVMRLDEGSSCNVSTIRMSVHCGTHSDAPYHFLEDGKKAAEMDLTAYVGPCQVVQVESEDAVHARDLESVDLERAERILFKTKRPCTEQTWRDDFTFMGVDAAELLAANGVRTVGLDTPSMDSMQSKTLDAHKILCRAGIALLENLKLDAVAPGEYELLALPLKLAESDSAPVRAVLRTLS